MPRTKADSARSTSAVDKEVGKRIRILRMEKGISQMELGAQLGVTFQQVQKYEKGTNRVSCGRLVQIADKLETNPHALLGWNDKNSVSLIDAEAYKLAKVFIELSDDMRRPVRHLINALIGGGHGQQ